MRAARRRKFLREGRGFVEGVGGAGVGEGVPQGSDKKPRPNRVQKRSRKVQMGPRRLEGERVGVNRERMVIDERRGTTVPPFKVVAPTRERLRGRKPHTRQCVSVGARHIIGAAAEEVNIELGQLLSRAAGRCGLDLIP